MFRKFFFTKILSFFCRSDFVVTLDFLRNLPLKNSKEKEEFFTTLVPKLRTFPVDLVARRLVTPLLARFALLEDSVVTHVIPHLLTPASGSLPSTKYHFLYKKNLCFVVYCFKRMNRVWAMYSLSFPPRSFNVTSFRK